MHTLYFSPGACSLAVHIALEEAGAPFALEQVSVRDGMTGRPAYLAVNPKGRVPALALGDGEVLTEAAAILAYIGHAFPQSGLIPRDPLALARCLEWLNWLSSEVHPAFGQVWRPQRSVTMPDLHADVREKGMENVRNRFDEIERRLEEGGGFAVAGRYGVADAYLLVFFLWGGAVGLDMAAYRAWSRHAAALARRPAVRRAMEREGLSAALGRLGEAG